jgi:meso-butanediol dehydrogenase/(S,S)-butanediol dehydrogenase/diacetyl reductase
MAEETDRMGIEGRRAIVTGAADGFGLEIARRLVELDAQVALVDLNAEKVEAARDVLGAAAAIPADVSDRRSVEAAVAAAAERLSGLDTVINSAGIATVGPLETITDSDWDRVLAVNLKGVFLTAQIAMPHLKASGRGRVVTIASDAGKRGAALLAPYSASKFGVIGFTEAIAGEVAPAGVTVNCVCPVGCPTTGMGKQLLAWKSSVTGAPPEEVVTAAAETNPVGRNATESDVAQATLFFLADESDFITGVALDVDGGAHVGFVPGVGR